jgi:hypothetical protein
MGSVRVRATREHVQEPTKYETVLNLKYHAAHVTRWRLPDGMAPIPQKLMTRTVSFSHGLGERTGG